jgi:hypothetical protein
MPRVAVRSFIAAAFAASMLPLAAPAQQQGAAPANCVKRSLLLERLAQKFHEQPVAGGLTDNGLLLEVYASRNGETWTIAMTMPNGTTCLVASGQEWQLRPLLSDYGPPA